MKQQYKYNTSALDRTIFVMDNDLNILEIQNPVSAFLSRADDSTPLTHIGKHISTLFELYGEEALQHKEMVMEKITKTRDTGKRCYFEHTLKRSGKTYYVHGHTTRDKQEGLIFCSVSYVAEEELIRPREEFVNEQLHRVINHINAGVFVVHGKMEDREDVSIYANDIYKEMFDCPTGDPRDSHKWNHEKSKECDNELIFGGKEHISYEHTTTDEQGFPERIFEIYKHLYKPTKDIFSIVTTVTDITTLKKQISLIEDQSDKIKQTARINELIVNNVNADLYFFDKRGKLVWKSSQQTCPGFSYIKHMDKELFRRSIEAREILTNKLEMPHDQILHCTYIPVKDPDSGIIDRVIVSVKDETEHEKIIDDLRKAKQKAEVGDKVKTEFLKNITHEIRTPLNSIQGFAQLLCENDLSDKERVEMFGYIKDNTDSLVNLINNIIDLSSLDAGITEIENNWFDIDTLFREIYFSLSLKRDKISDRMTFRYDVPVELKGVLVNSNRKRVLQVVRNFCTNALKYTNEGSVLMGYDFRDGGLYVYVQDTGIGIPEEAREKVFNKFEKFGSYQPGAGIGLTICKAIVKAMNGRIGNMPNQPRGTIFYAWFPCETKRH